MFSRRKAKSKGPTATEKFLSENPEPKDIGELFRQEDLALTFREKSKILIGYFLGKNSRGSFNMEDIFQYIMDVEKRKDQKDLFNLYQMSNLCLHRVFADSTKLAEMALQTVGDEDPKKQYALGIFSRIISRAIDQWPEEIWQTFWFTEGSVEKIITNIDKTCIYQGILDCFAQKHHPHISTLLWYIFLSFVPERLGRIYIKNPPYYVEFMPNAEKYSDYDSTFAIYHKSLKRDHKLNIISLFNEYFKNSLIGIEDFHSMIFKFVCDVDKSEINDATEKTVDFYPLIFETARIIGPNADVKDKCKQIIESSSPSDLVVQYCAQYLAVCSSIMEQEEVEEVVKRLLTVESKQFTITGVLKLISYVIEDNPEWVDSFRQNLVSLVLPIWKEHSLDHLKDSSAENTDQSHFMIIDAILTIGRIIYNSELNEEIDKLPKKNKSSENGDDDSNDEKSDDDQEEAQNAVEEKFKDVGNEWGEFKQIIINWSNPEYIDLKKTATPEERKYTIVVQFNEEENEEE